jgi:hypothetical protein
VPLTKRLVVVLADNEVVTRALLPAVPATELDTANEHAASVNNLRAVVASDIFSVIVGVWVVPVKEELPATRVATGAVVSITKDVLAAKLPTNPDVGSVRLALLPRLSRIVPLLRARADVLG